MARFAFVSTMGGLPWGGSEELWSGAALRLAQRGHAVAASVVGWQSDPRQLVALQRMGVNINRRPRIHGLTTRAFNRILRRSGGDATYQWLERFRPDLVVISQGDALGGVEWMLGCRSKGWRYASIAQANWEGWWPDDATVDRARDGYGGAARAYFVSKGNLNLFFDQMGGPIANTEVIPNPFTVSYRPRMMAPVNRREPFRLACVARLYPMAKGQDLLLRVLASRKWQSRPLEVGFYGEGPCANTLKRLAVSLDVQNVSFKGHVDDVEEIWRQNDALILPSRFEGTPLTLIEAMLCSRMAIVTDVGGNTELIEDDSCGFTARAPTVELLDDAMERAWQRREEWFRLGEAAGLKVRACIPEDPIGGFAARLIDLQKTI